MSSVPDCPSVGRTRKVSSTSEDSGSYCNLFPMEEGWTVSINIQDVASHSSSVPSSRLVAMQQRMEASGISESVTRRIYSSAKYLPPTICMITGGNLGWIGVLEGRWIPSILL